MDLTLQEQHVCKNYLTAANHTLFMSVAVLSLLAQLAVQLARVLVLTRPAQDRLDCWVTEKEVF